MVLRYLLTGGAGARGAGAAAPAEFAPDALANLALWLKADALSLANDDPVATWTASTGPNAAQATGAKQPLYKAASATWNGKPYVSFDGIDDCLQTAALDLSAGGAATIFLVVAMPTAGVEQVIFETSADYLANSGAMRFEKTTANVVQGSVWTTGGGATGQRWLTTGATATLTAVPKCISAFVDTEMPVGSAFTEGKLSLWVNNGKRLGTAANAAGVTGNLGNLVANIGARNDGASLSSRLDVAEIVVYDRKLTHRDRGRVDLYLRDKYDLYA